MFSLLAAYFFVSLVPLSLYYSTSSPLLSPSSRAITKGGERGRYIKRARGRRLMTSIFNGCARGRDKTFGKVSLSSGGKALRSARGNVLCGCGERVEAERVPIGGKDSPQLDERMPL